MMNKILSAKIILVLLIILFLATILLLTSINFVFTVKIKNQNVLGKININYLFKIINITRQIYPKTKKEKKKNKEMRKVKITNVSICDIKKIYCLVKKIKIKELYSDVIFGNLNFELTSSVFVIINAVYVGIINKVKSKKIYLNIKPDFQKNYLICDVKINVKIKILYLIFLIIKIYKLNKMLTENIEEGDLNEGDRIYKKSYGDNC